MPYVTYRDGTRVLQGSAQEAQVRARLGLAPAARSKPASSATVSAAPINSNFGLGDIVRGIGSVATGLIPGTLDDKLFDAITRPSATRPPPPGSSAPPIGTLTNSVCRPGTVRVGDTCVDPRAALPGGDPLLSPVGAPTPTAAAGMMGMPSFEPTVLSTIRLRCGKGLVLGIDNKCYPKAVLSRRSKWRKWRQPPRPKFTRAELRSLEVRDSVVERIKELNKKAGLRVPTTKKKK